MLYGVCADVNPDTVRYNLLTDHKLSNSYGGEEERSGF
jgi:hypothetical protein